MSASRPAGAVARVETTDNLDLLLAVLPERIRAALASGPLDEILEIVLDLGRIAEARFPHEARSLGREPVTREDLAATVARLGSFTSDNRAGIEGTLHRIAALRNRRGEIIGLTCRVGRAVSGTIEIVRDVFAEGKSVLLLGRPGVGKTTLLREAARVLADDFAKRVVVVDTSNEIAGDGDVPHSGIGKARRLQVPAPEQQHALMIEAVENHMPEVVVVDEIGTHQEALAARTIAERGVQLIATAHGTTLENLLANPTLADLVGGVEAVTLGDEEARRRRTQKTILERRAAPTFDVLIEIQDRHRFAVHANVADAVDTFLAGREPSAELRARRDDGSVDVVPAAGESRAARAEEAAPHGGNRRPPRRIYPYGVSFARLERAVRSLGLPTSVTTNLREADVVLALKGQELKNPPKLVEARKRGLPILSVRSNTRTQIEQQLARLFPTETVEEDAMQEAQDAIDVVLAENRPVDLEPQPAGIRRLQHLIAQERGLASESRGREPRRWVTLYPPLAPDRPA